MISKAQIKDISALKNKKDRTEKKVFVVEGEKMIEEAIKANCKIQYICATNEWIIKNKNIAKNYNIIEVNESELKKISSLTTPNNVLAVVNEIDEKEITTKNNLILMLDSINNPGNLGTIIRIASWFGIKDIICSKDTVDCYNNKVLQATMGAIFHINIVYLDLIPFLNSLNKSYNIYGTVLQGGKNIYEENLSKEGIIIIGNESHGISNQVKDFVNCPLTIPTFSATKDIESLNASIATAIVVSEFKRR
jgi:TrmH family RNA methyltransferase